MFRRRKGKSPRITTVQGKGNEVRKEEGTKEHVKTPFLFSYLSPCSQQRYNMHFLTTIFIRRVSWKSFRRFLIFAVVASIFVVSVVFLNQNGISSSSSLKFDQRHNLPTIIDMTTFQHVDNSVVDQYQYQYHYNEIALNGHRLMPLERARNRIGEVWTCLSRSQDDSYRSQ